MLLQKFTPTILREKAQFIALFSKPDLISLLSNAAEITFDLKSLPIKHLQNYHFFH